MARNPELIKTLLTKGTKGKIKAGKRGGLVNILSELRQCLCHPFCFDPRVEDKSLSEVETHRNLVSASGKLILLGIMLPKLQERGHRVLIFSQFLRNLDILEDFLTDIGLRYARIDGQMSALTKQRQIDAFNAPDSSLFAMLLSTRAGGVGINLATADTVIIYDPDFNPHQDIQALSRAHRIGQKNKVLCFQLTTKNSVEEKIMQIGRKKMALDHALIESMDAAEDAGESLESLLKHAAEALFGGNDKEKITYDEAAVEKLLDRSQIESTSAGDDQSTENQFSFARVWANNDLVDNTNADSRENSEPPDTSVWENILKQREEEHEKELAAQRQEYGRGARRRVTQVSKQGTIGNYSSTTDNSQGVDYNGHVGFIEGVDDIVDHVVLTAEQHPQELDSAGSDIEMGDELYIDNNEVDVDEYESDGFQDPATLARPRQKGTKGTKRPAPKPNTPDRYKKKMKTVNASSSNGTHSPSGGENSIREQRFDRQFLTGTAALVPYPALTPGSVVPTQTNGSGETASEQTTTYQAISSTTTANTTIDSSTTDGGTALHGRGLAILTGPPPVSFENQS